MKNCNVCKEAKPFTDFNKDRNTHDGLCRWCRSCNRAKLKRWYEANRSAVIEKVTHWQRENQDRYNQKNRTWYDSNLAHAREYNRGCQRLRRERIQANGGRYTKEEFESLCESVDHRCLCCGQRGKLTADHVIPVSIGGESRIENIQPLCRSCNAKKGSRSIDYRIARTSQ